MYHRFPVAPSLPVDTSYLVQACLLANGVDVLIAFQNDNAPGGDAYPGYLFGLLQLDPSPALTVPYPGVTEWFHSNQMRMCRGTSGSPQPRIYSISTAGRQPSTFDPAMIDGIHPETCTVPPQNTVLPAMELDPVRDVIVLFGGSTDGTPQNTVWEGTGLTGEGFSQVYWSGSQPVARFSAALCYDPQRALMLLYGGTDGGTNYYGRGCWGWNGSLWVRAGGRETTISGWDNRDSMGESAAGYDNNNFFFRRDTRMAYDEARGCPVVFRGTQAD